MKTVSIVNVLCSAQGGLKIGQAMPRRSSAVGCEGRVFAKRNDKGGHHKHPARAKAAPVAVVYPVLYVRRSVRAVRSPTSKRILGGELRCLLRKRECGS